jgi:hypothetical protein
MKYFDKTGLGYILGDFFHSSGQDEKTAVKWTTSSPGVLTGVGPLLPTSPIQILLLH